jgi:pimeloyl-ACP methyl ester carboxylesterase
MLPARLGLFTPAYVPGASPKVSGVSPPVSRYLPSGGRSPKAKLCVSSDHLRLEASNAWHQAFGQDIVDGKMYGPVAAPTLVLGTTASHPRLRDMMVNKGSDVRAIEVENSGHYLAEEQPDIVVERLREFLT